jgi:hypothetical protein
MGLLISSLNRTSISIDPAMGRRFNSIPSSLRSILSIVSFGKKINAFLSSFPALLSLVKLPQVLDRLDQLQLG